MRVLGIDPGLSGALAVMDTHNRPRLVVTDIPVYHSAHGKGKRAHINVWIMREWLRSEFPIDLAIVEQVGAMPGQGVTSMFRFGQATGICYGLLIGMGVKTFRVTPRVWKKAMGVGREKDQARQIVTEMYPSNAGEFKRKKDVDRAEATLIAVYGSRNFIMEQ